MGKRILVITGSPRPNGNSNAIATAFITGAMAAGNDVKVFDAANATLGGCHAEGNCVKKGCCGLKDDTARLNELMRWADALILVSPLYWKGFTSQIKRAIDTFYQYCSPKAKSQIKIKETGLIATAKSADGFAFDCIVGEYNHINAVLGFESKFTLLCPGLAGVDDYKNHEFLIETAVKYGMNF